MTGARPGFFQRAANCPAACASERRLFFYPGSSIGNFTPDEARAFLRRARAQCDDDGGLLIGIDLVKDSAMLDAAYDDALGVTAAFNLNLLRHLNHLVGADFDVRQWRHRGLLQRRRKPHRNAPGSARSADRALARRQRAVSPRGERIHTENSYKYRESAAVGLLEQSGFQATRVWTDPAGWFAVIHARAIAA